MVVYWPSMPVTGPIESVFESGEEPEIVVLRAFVLFGGGVFVCVCGVLVVVAWVCVEVEEGVGEGRG